MLSCCFVFVSPQTSIKDMQHRFGKCCLEERLQHGGECDTGCTVHHVQLKHSAVILLLDRRKWDETQSICLMKADPLCFGLLKEEDT